MIVDTALAALSADLVQTLVGWWLRRSQDEPKVDVGHIIDAQVVEDVDRQQLRHEFEVVENLVYERLKVDAENEFVGMDPNIRAAAVEAVARCFSAADLTEEDLRKVEANSTALAQLVARRSPQVVDSLSESERAFFTAMLLESSSVALAMIAAGPLPHAYALARLLREQGGLGKEIRRALHDLPSAERSVSPIDSGNLYRKAVVASLDQGELVGFTLAAATRRFRLSGTYTRPDVRIDDMVVPVDLAVGDYQRMHILGPAGSGKTALLRWLAVSCARQSLTGPLARLNQLLPIYVSPRRLTGSEFIAGMSLRPLLAAALPTPEGVFDSGYLAEQCAAGRVLVLIDGLDEVADETSERCEEWLKALVAEYPRCLYIVSTRSGVDRDNFSQIGFTGAYIQPLDRPQVADLIRRWFGPAAPVGRPTEPSSAPAAQVIDLITSNPQLSELATSPLMCVVACAVYQDRGAEALQGTEIYGGFIDMLIERRDVERGLPNAGQLSRSVALIFLEELAAYLMLSGSQEMSRHAAVNRIDGVAQALATRVVPPEEVVRYLIARSGLLIEPVPGRVRFLHLTFMEYLAARHFANNDDVQLLIDRAHQPMWREAVVMAASHLRRGQAEYLLQHLLDRFRTEQRRQPMLASLLQQCMAEVPRLDPALRAEIENAWRSEQAWASNIWLVTVADPHGVPDPRALRQLHRWLREDAALRHDSVVTTGEPGPIEDRSVLRVSGELPLAAVVAAVIQWRSLMPEAARPVVTIGGVDTLTVVRIFEQRVNEGASDASSRSTTGWGQILTSSSLPEKWRRALSEPISGSLDDVSPTAGGTSGSMRTTFGAWALEGCPRSSGRRCSGCCIRSWKYVSVKP